MSSRQYWVLKTLSLKSCDFIIITVDIIYVAEIRLFLLNTTTGNFEERQVTNGMVSSPKRE